MIATIVLDIKGVKIELTVEQATELLDLLLNLVGEKSIERVEYIPAPHPVYPYRWPPYTWTCLTSGTTATLTIR